MVLRHNQFLQTDRKFCKLLAGLPLKMALEIWIFSVIKHNNSKSSILQRNSFIKWVFNFYILYRNNLPWYGSCPIRFGSLGDATFLISSDFHWSYRYYLWIIQIKTRRTKKYNINNFLCDCYSYIVLYHNWKYFQIFIFFLTQNRKVPWLLFYSVLFCCRHF